MRRCLKASWRSQVRRHGGAASHGTWAPLSTTSITVSAASASPAITTHTAASSVVSRPSLRAPSATVASPPSPLACATEKARRKLRCLRGAYHSSRSVAQLLSLLLEPDTAHASNATLRGSCPVTEELAALHVNLEGSPHSLQYEGPLSDRQLMAVRDLATHAAVTYLRTHVFAGDLCPSLVTPTAHLWEAESVHAYRHALLAARRARLDEGGTFNGYHHLKEAGQIARQTFCTNTCNTRLAAEWSRLIRCYTAFLPDRSHIHELENLPQEVAIGELLRDAVADVQRAAAASPSSAEAFALDCVVDVGGGNGFLAAQVAEQLHCDGVVIDPFFPAHAIDCCPRVWPDTPHRTHAAVPRRQTLHRTMALFRDVRWCDVVPAAPSRTALIAKHLCGSGVDEVLRQLEAQDCLPRILVLAPCCFNKITYDTYCNQDYLWRTMGIKSEAALARVHRLTDWNMSCYQSTHEALLACEEAARRSKKAAEHEPDGKLLQKALLKTKVNTETFSYQRRSGPRSIVNSITCTHAFALLVEGLINYGRMEWLRSRGYEVRHVQYVPDVVTPKNKCLVAVRRPRIQ